MTPTPLVLNKVLYASAEGDWEADVASIARGGLGGKLCAQLKNLTANDSTQQAVAFASLYVFLRSPRSVDMICVATVAPDIDL